MQSFEDIKRELSKSGKGAELNALAQSKDGARLAAMLGTVLSTEEGRRLAANIKKLMEK